MRGLATATSTVAHLNLVTHLAFERAHALAKGGMSVDDAETIAENELRAGLRLTGPQARGIAISIVDGDTDANAYALAVGSMLIQIAITRGGPFDATLQEVVNSVSLDLLDGAFTQATLDEMLVAHHAIDSTEIEGLLAARFAQIGVVSEVPDLDRVLDDDLDSVANRYDNCRFVANPMQENVDGEPRSRSALRSRARRARRRQAKVPCTSTSARGKRGIRRLRFDTQAPTWMTISVVRLLSRVMAQSSSQERSRMQAQVNARSRIRRTTRWRIRRSNVDIRVPPCGMAHGRAIPAKCV